MTKNDLFQNLIDISIFALPILFMSTFTVGLSQVATEWHSEFLIVIGGIAALFGFIFIKKLVHHWIDLILGTVIFVAAYLTLVILVFDAFVGLYDSLVYPLFLLLIGFLLVYPLVEWWALADTKQKDALLPLQLKVEHFLEKLLRLARGRKVIIIGLYVLVYGTAFSLLYWQFQEWVIAALLPALILPLLNLGYLTGRGLGDDLLWWKEFKRSKETHKLIEDRFHWLAVDWDTKYLGVFQKIALGNRIVMGLGIFLFVSSIYGLYTDVLTLATRFTVSFTVGLTLVTKTLILSGRNAVKETQKLLDATRVKEKPSRFSLFYPIYIGVAILLVIAVEFLVNVSDSIEQLATGLGVAEHRVLLAGSLLGEELVMILTTCMVLLLESQPISIREVQEDEFNDLAPVEQHIALQKWYQDVQTRIHPEERSEILEKTIQYAPDLLKVQFLLPFLNSSYYPLSSYARREFKTLLVTNREVGKYCLRLLADGDLPFNTQKTVTNLIALEPYMSALRELAKKGKISAKAVWALKKTLDHDAYVNSVAVDETYLYTGAGDGKVLVWDKTTWGLVRTLEGHEKSVTSVVADKSYLYTGAADQTVRVWDKATWVLVTTLEGHESEVTSVVVDGDYIYTGSRDQTVRVWDKATWTLLRTLDGVGYIESMVTDKFYLYTGAEDGKVHIWDKATWALEKTLDIDGRVFSLFTDEYYLYSGADDGDVQGWVWVWDKATWALVTSYEAHMNRINSVVADEHYLYTGSYKMMLVWDKATWSLVTTLEGHEDTITSVLVDENYLYTGAGDKTVRVWDKATLTAVTITLEHPYPVTSMATDETYLYSSAEDQTVRVWNKKTWGLVTTLEGHESSILSMDVDMSYLYTGAEDQTVRVWNKKTWGLVTTLEGHTDALSSVVADETFLYTGAMDQTVRVWDKATWTLVNTLNHDGPVLSVVADETYLYTGAEDQTVRVWDKATWSLVKTLNHDGPVWSIFVDEEHIYTGSANMRYGQMLVWVWNKVTWTASALEGHLEPIKSILADKHYLYTGETGGLLVWDKTRRKRITHFEPYTDTVVSVCADNKYIYAGLEDGTITMWTRLPPRNLFKALLPYGLMGLLAASVSIAVSLTI